MNDDICKYCDVCSSNIHVKHYPEIDMDLCDKCQPMMMDLIEEGRNEAKYRDTWGSCPAGATAV